MEKKQITDHLEEIQSESIEYVKTSLDYFKLLGFKIVLKSTDALITFIFALAIGCMALLLISISASYALGIWLKNIPLGFLFMGGFYIVLLLLFFAIRKKFLQPKLVQIWSKIIYSKK